MVEWKKLGDIAKRNKGIPITAGQMSELNTSNGNVRVFAAGQTLADINETDLPKNCAHIKPSIIVKSRGYIDFVFYEKPFTHKNEMWSYSFDDKEEGKFFYYYLTTKTELFRKKAKANSVKLPQLCVSDTDDYLVPYPSHSEQGRIVGVLDTFTSSIDNLKQQIALRRKQYEYYRDQLLDLEGKEGVEMKKLSEACEIRRGIRVVKKQLKDNDLYPVFQNSIAPMGYYDQFNRVGNIPYIICAGSSSGSVGYCCTPFWAADDCFTIESSKVNRRYTYYLLKKNNNNLFKLVRKGSMPRLPHEAIDNMVIPIPSLSEQQRIVDILDKFEASIQNLEAQLSQREKQYEYYRNKLLTFD